MKHKIKILYGLLLLGILLSFVILITGGGNYGTANSFESLVTLVITSVIIFITSIIILLKQSQTLKKKIAIGVLILLTFPLSALGGIYLIQKAVFSVRSAIYFHNVENSNKLDYSNSKKQIKAFIEMNVDINREIGYEDIYLIKASIIDTIFYSPNGTDKIAGILISRITLNDSLINSISDSLFLNDIPYMKKQVADYPYVGCSFIYSNQNIIFNPNDIIGSTIEGCINQSREQFLSGKDAYRMNSLKFWDYQDNMWYEKITGLLD
jgi:hypothetical protein